MCRFAAVLVLIVAATAFVNSANAIGCPEKCSCQQRTVRCLRQQLDKIPKVPPDTNIIDLRYNHIREIPSQAFSGLKHLHTIFLNENQIVTVHSAAFQGLPSLKYLYLNKNHITIIAEDAFHQLDRLQSLYLQYNNISSFDAATFSNLPNLERLFLYSNKISHIPVGAFDNMPALKRLRLDENTLDCSCSIMSFLKVMHSREQPPIDVTITCHSPAEMKGKTFHELNEGDFHCSKPSIVEEPNDVEVTFGGTAVFTCRVVGDPAPDITWMLNSNEIHIDYSRVNILPDGSLRIDKASDTDIGQYECMAKNDMGEVKSKSAKMIVHEHSEEQPDPQRPQIVQPPRDVQVTSTESIILHCATDGIPAPQITWYFNGNAITQNTDRSHIHANGTLIINHPLVEDSGVYKCEAANYLGSISAIANVKVNETSGTNLEKVVPTIDVAPDNQTFSSGTHVVLECRAEGHPKPTIAWQRDELPLGLTNRITLSDDNTTISIEHVKESDAGHYTCIAENSVGKSSVTAAISVVNSLGPPRLIFEPDDVEAYTGTTIELPCKGEGEPAPQTKWKKDGRTLIQSEKYRFSAAGSLYINNITEEDSGRYECSIVNSNGRATASGLVTVRKNLELAPGDRYVRIAIVEATREVDAAINQTIADLFASNEPKHHGDLFRIVRFPTGPARELARASEVYERAIVSIRKHVEDGKMVKTNVTDFDYKDILSPEYLDLLAQLSGCAAHRITPNCTDMCYHSRYRSIDGTCNNYEHPLWGSGLSGFRRLLPPRYENELEQPVGWNQEKKYNGFKLPSARLVSTSLIRTETITPDEQITHMVMQWGQFLDHDLDHALPPVISESWEGVDCKKTCDYVAPCYPIEIPPNDPRVSNRRCIDFVRSSAVCGSGMTSIFFGSVEPREQINQLTSFLDASQVYGYAEPFARDLRNLTGETGTLREGVHFPDQKALLPFAAPTDGMDCRRDLQASDVNCFTAGDIRVNEQAGLLAMHTIWLREHNRLAAELKEHNPHWDGDTVYQEARKIVGAVMQKITYDDWLPLIVGEDGMKMLGAYKGYNSELNPGISNEFATAALRFGHSLINPILHRLDYNFTPIAQGHLPLHKAFFAPWRLVYEGGVDPLMRGLYTVPAKLKRPDQNLNTELTEKLFHTAHAVALDLAAINIQRSRDHAIPSYNSFRKICNMTVAKTFDDLIEISDKAVRDKLQELYGHVDNIDIWVGGILEDQLKDAKVGPLFRCLLIEQFGRLRDGDRLWYEHEKTFKPEQLEQVKKQSLARVLCDNGDNITLVTKNIFLLPKLQGGYTNCNTLPRMDLRYWQDCEKCRRKDPEVRRQRREERQRQRRDIKKALTNETKLHYDSDYVNEDMNEERIEGLESLIENFQKSLRQMRKKLKKLERLCSNLNITTSVGTDKASRAKSKAEKKEKRAHCIDTKGIRRMNKEIWYRDDCTKCECTRRQINCTTEKCIELKCDTGLVPYKKQGECCTACIKEGSVPSTTTTQTSAKTA